MITYAIKTPEASYYCYSPTSIYPTEWTYSLKGAKFYNNIDEATLQAKKIAEAHFPCKVVKVEIKELEE